MTPAGLVLLGLTLVGGLLWWAKQPRVYKNLSLDKLGPCIAALLNQMGPGSTLIADRHPPPGFLQLALRDSTLGRYTIEFGFPEMDWSTTRFTAVHSAIVDHGFAPRIESGSGPVSRFLRVRSSGSADQVTGAALRLFAVVAGALEWGSDPLFDVRIEGSLRGTPFGGQGAS